MISDFHLVNELMDLLVFSEILDIYESRPDIIDLMSTVLLGAVISLKWNPFLTHDLSGILSMISILPVKTWE